jgi:aspartyl-tRNA(Asn)/glutamyl-tRNA(Gln) amidotransferase subunit C
LKKFFYGIKSGDVNSTFIKRFLLKLEGDLNSIFEFIEKLNELKTDNVEPLTSVAETTLKLRSDEVMSKDIRDQILKNSPESNEDFFVVPKVVE